MTNIARIDMIKVTAKPVPEQINQWNIYIKGGQYLKTLPIAIQWGSLSALKHKKNNILQII